MGSVRLASALLVPAFCVSFCMELAAQSATASASLTGSVVNSGGDALPDAELELLFRGPGANTYTTQADTEGRFLFDRLPPGNYTLEVQRDGYVAHTYKDPESGEARIIRIGAAAERGSVPDLVIRMVPEAVISGRVLSADDMPVQGARVTVLDWEDEPDGTRILAPLAGDASTGPDGRFTIGGLAAGTYYLTAEDPSLWIGYRQPTRQPEDLGPIQRDLLTFYPGAATAGSATPIRLSAGESRHGADIQLRRGPVYQVAGRVIDPETGKPPYDAMMTWYPLLGKEIDVHHYQLVKPLDSHGMFQMPPLPAGDYAVLVTSGGATTEQEVTVSDHDLTDLVLMADPGFNLNGHVMVLGDETRNARLPATVALHHVETPLIGITSGRVDANGRFVINAVTPGTYDVVAETGGRPMIVQSLQIDSKTVQGPRIELFKPVHLEVTLAPVAPRR